MVQGESQAQVEAIAKDMAQAIKLLSEPCV
jgi:hypothetical protein